MHNIWTINAIWSKGGSKRCKLSQKRYICRNIGEMYKFCGNRGVKFIKKFEIGVKCNMHHWLRGDIRLGHR